MNMSYQTIILNIDPVLINGSSKNGHTNRSLDKSPHESRKNNFRTKIKIDDPANDIQDEMIDIEVLEEDDDFDSYEEDQYFKGDTQIKKVTPSQETLDKGLSEYLKSNRNKTQYEQKSKQNVDKIIKVYSYPKKNKIKDSLDKIKSEMGNERIKEKLDEKQLTNCEDLPEGWVQIIANNGKVSFLHKSSRVCTDSRPYYLGPGNVTKSQLDYGNILSEIRGIKQTLVEQQKMLDVRPRNGYNLKDTFPAKTVQELSDIEQRINHEVGFRENVTMHLRKVLGPDHSLDRAIQFLATDEVYITCNFSGKCGKNGLNNFNLFTEILFDAGQRKDHEEFGKDVYKSIKRAHNRFYKKMARKKTSPTTEI